MKMDHEEMIQDVINHLDSSIARDVKFMSVNVDENCEETKSVDSIAHGAANGRPANVDVAYLDMLMDQGLMDSLKKC